jgi:HEAT repeat protein
MEPEDQQIAALIADLDQHDKPTIRTAVDQLIALARNSPPLCERLELRLAEAGHPNYWPVAYILGNLPNPSRLSITRLVDALDHRDPDIRWAIALLLVRIAKENTDIDLISSLIQLCASGSDNQKRMALYAIRDLSLSDAASLTALLNALHDSEPTVRVAAAICLKPRHDVGDAGRNVLLEVYLNDAALKVRHAVAITLASLAAPPAEFVTALRKNSESENEQTKKAAIAALELLEKRRSASSGSASDR